MPYESQVNDQSCIQMETDFHFDSSQLPDSEMQQEMSHNYRMQTQI